MTTRDHAASDKPVRLFFSSSGGGGVNEVVGGRFLGNQKWQINHSKAMTRDHIPYIQD